MTKIDIISGFLGAGKTTLIKKLIKEGFKGEKLVLIENEFGEIGIDGGFLKEGGVEITEMNSGCICCSLVGDFGAALKEVLAKYSPDRVMIEPSGVGKLSDVIKAVKDIELGEGVSLNSKVAVVDTLKCKMYMKNFGEFFNNQIEHASSIILSRSQNATEEKLNEVIKLIRSKNIEATIVTTPWELIIGKKLLEAMENSNNLEKTLLEEERKAQHHHDATCGCGDHHHYDETCECGEHHHHHDETCECGEHHHYDEACGCGEHHHHDEACGCGEHHNHHDETCECGDHHHHDDETCECGEHHHYDEACEYGEHHHHNEACGCGHDHHHADEVFTSWGIETVRRFDLGELKVILEKLSNTEEYGTILRAKGILQDSKSNWFCFDLVPGEYEIREEAADYTGRLCVIGTKLNKEKLKQIFGTC